MLVTDGAASLGYVAASSGGNCGEKKLFVNHMTMTEQQQLTDENISAHCDLISNKPE